MLSDTVSPPVTLPQLPTANSQCCTGYEERLKKFHAAHRTSELWIVGTEGGPKIDVATVALFPALVDELAKEHAAFDLLVR